MPVNLDTTTIIAVTFTYRFTPALLHRVISKLTYLHVLIDQLGTIDFHSQTYCGEKQ